MSSLRAAGWVLLVVLAFLAIGVVFMVNFDWNRAKPWINQRVSEATGRSFAIHGNLSLTWSNPHNETGWRGLVPWPRLNAENVQLGNAEWSKTGSQMARIERLTFSLNPLSLLTHKIQIPTLELNGPTLSLERAADGKSNWTLTSGGDKAPSDWQLELQRLVLHDGTIKVLDAVNNIDLQVNVDSLPQDSPEGYGIGWKLKGTFHRAQIRGSGKAGAVLSLQQSKAPYPLQAALQAGTTNIEVQGTLTKPEALAALSLQLKLSGASMADLYPLTGITLPKTPPFSTQGHLAGTLGKEGGRWLYDHFKGRVGESDIAGTLEYIAQKPRPLLKGQVQSGLLRLEDLAPLIGADSNASKAKRGVAVVQPADKVLPVEKFDATSWGSIDAHVKFSGAKILHDKKLPIDSLVAEIHLQDGVLSLTPLTFGIAGGKLVAMLKLNGRGHAIRANMQVSARSLKIKELFPTLDTMQASLGEIGADATLAATGNSVAELLGTADGELIMLARKGTISKFLLEAMGLNVGSVVVTKLFGDKQVRLNCLASAFHATNGLMQTRVFVLDTDDSVVHVNGQINLAHEELALDIEPKNKALRVLSLRAPLYVRGTFKKPDIGVDKATVALKVGAAVAMGAVTPAAALLPLLNIGGQADDECAPVLAAMTEKPKAATSSRQAR